METTPGTTPTNTETKKRSTSETGHAKNVANFHDLIVFCQGYGQDYNPSNPLLQIPQLIALHNQAEAKVAEVIPKIMACNDAINARIQAFENLKPLSTRLMNALQATQASSQKVDDAKTFHIKIRGERATTKSIGQDSPAPATISASQQSYDQLIQHFEGLVTLLASEPSYQPNEAALQAHALQNKLTLMKHTNNAVAFPFTQLSNARISRNSTLYDDQEGLVTIAAGIKKYIKSVFGAASPQYKQVSGITIRKPNL